MVKYSILIFIYILILHQWVAASFYYQLDEFFNLFYEQSFGNDADDDDDRINIDQLNELNKQDMKNMPEIDDYSNENNALRWIKWYSRVSLRYYQISAELSWNYETNMTEENQKAMTAQTVNRIPFIRLALNNAKKFAQNLKNSKNDELKRIFHSLASGVANDDDEKTVETSKLHSKMGQVYASTEVCEIDNKNKCYTLSPYLEQLMHTEKDYNRLTWAWKGWHDNCGNQIRPLYLKYIDLLNENVQKNGYKDLSELWIADYDMGNQTEFETTIDKILEAIMPLYKQLHAYVRGRLCTLYPNKFDCNRSIPAHLLGNMWAQSWENRFDDLIPYPNSPLVNLTKILEKKKFTIHQMFTTAEDFFTSIGLYSMTRKFWKRSLFEKPNDRVVACHAAATDLKYHDDYRVRICTEITHDYFYTIHHEMGHVEYYMAYDNEQPYLYQDGANSAFHEAIGDTIGMYAISPNHLVKLRFLDEEDLTKHYEINFLLSMALQKIAFLPFGYAIDKYRFLLFRNQINRQYELNSMWWALRVEHGGVMAAVHRSDEVNFDAGAKYHVPSNTPYYRYFLAHILQFQFYRGLCRLQGHKKNIHLCDIYGNKHVGKRFKRMLAMGSSERWPKILESLTGEDKVDPQAMLDYFQPLYEWLKEENSRKGYPVGWM